MREPVVITDAVNEPITLAELQAQARIDTTDAAQDDLINDVFIPAARDYIEWRAGITVHEKTLELVMDCFPYSEPITLPHATPLISITSVKYKDSAGTETTWGSSNYVTSAGGPRELGKIAPAYGQAWPSFTPYPLDPVRIRYKGGIATASPIVDASATVKHAMCLLVSKMWLYREAVIVPDRPGINQLVMEYGLEPMIMRLQATYAF